MRYLFMELEKQNIVIAIKLLKNAMAALDEKFRVLPSKLDDIRLDQACDIMKNYDLVNYLRNIIINQLLYLEHESVEKKDAEEFIKEIIPSFNANLEKINGFKSISDYTANSPIDQFSYYKGLKNIHEYFDQQLQKGGLNSTVLDRIKNAVDYGAREGGNLEGKLNTIQDLFKTTQERLSKELAANPEEAIQEQSRDLLSRTRTILSLSKQKQALKPSTQNPEEPPTPKLARSLTSKILRKASAGEKLKEDVKNKVKI